MNASNASNAPNPFNPSIPSNSSNPSNPSNSSNPVIAAIVPPDVLPQRRDCMRCGNPTEMRFYGCCPACTEALYVKYPGEGRYVEAAPYEPKMNVTPNAVAVRDD